MARIGKPLFVVTSTPRFDPKTLPAPEPIPVKTPEKVMVPVGPPGPQVGA